MTGREHNQDPGHAREADFDAIPAYLRDLGKDVPGLDPPIWYVGVLEGERAEPAERDEVS